MDNGEQLIAKYFSHGLNSSELEELRALLKENENLRKQFEFEKNVQSAVQHSEFERLNKVMDEMELEIQDSTEFKQTGEAKIKKLPVWRVAAAIAFLVCLGLFALKIVSPGGSKIADSYYSLYPNTSFNITRGQAIESKEALAFTAYEERDFENAIKYFISIDDEDKNDYIWFYLANSYFETKELEEAIKNYEKSIGMESFVPESHWYMALAYLKQNEKEEALAQLNLLINNYKYKQKEAKELSKKIR